jgi:hypothetical protein
MQSFNKSTRFNLDSLQDWLTCEIASQVRVDNAEELERIVNLTRRSE